MSELKTQEFYCRDCDNITTIESLEHYWNYKCSKCGNIIKLKDYTAPIFKGLPNTKL